MTIINIQSDFDAPIGCTQVFNPSYRNMTSAEIMNMINPINNWFPYGYNVFYICKKSGTVHISKQQKQTI